jgi:two-component system OmpR family sensor kinase
MFKSIRWRLLAWHAGILILTVAGFGAALYFQIRKARFDEIDADLQSSARSLEGTLRGFPPPVLDGGPQPPMGGGGRGGGPGGPGGGPGGPGGPGGGPPPFGDGPSPDGSRPGSRPPPQRESMEHRMERMLTLPNSSLRTGNDSEAEPYFVVWLGNGEVFKASPLPSDVTMPAYDPTNTDDTGRLDMQQRGSFREVRVVGTRRTEVLVGRSIRREQQDLTILAGQLVLTGLGVLAVGLVGGFFLSSRAVRPIAAMSATAASISASNLDHRIDVKEVDSELGNLAMVLNDMFARLEAAFERQARFTADASHELRTPLTVIHSFAELALSKPRTSAEYQETLDTCVRATRRMKSIVEGLLTLARADAGKLELKRQPLDLGALVTDAASLLEPLAVQKNVQLCVQAPPLEMLGDMTRLAQVVTNLVTNAINYNRPGGTVSVTLTTEGDEAVLTVADTGCGIPEEDRPHLFERFYRVDKARSRELGGSGLGLAICKSIVEGLGGTIGFTTELNEGSSFVVRLPRPLAA